MLLVSSCAVIHPPTCSVCCCLVRISDVGRLITARVRIVCCMLRVVVNVLLLSRIEWKEKAHLHTRRSHSKSPDRRSVSLLMFIHEEISELRHMHSAVSDMQLCRFQLIAWSLHDS